MIWKYYPPTGVLKLFALNPDCRLIPIEMGGNIWKYLPAYWGIETVYLPSRSYHYLSRIWKYYPPTGVLKHTRACVLSHLIENIWKYYPPTGVLKLTG